MVVATWSKSGEEKLGEPVSFDGAEPVEPTAGPVVVVVTESSDPATGGHEAVEMSQESHVVFGG
jgi:hypothetical protein